MFSKDHSGSVWAMLKPASDYYNGPRAGLLVKRARDPRRGSDDCNVKEQLIRIARNRWPVKSGK